MISKALPQEKKTIYGIWKQVFAGDDGGFTSRKIRWSSKNLEILFPR